MVDTDPGVDDTMAILFALRSPEVSVEGLTTVFGNVGVEQSTRNALKILEIADRCDIPVAQGAAKPLLRPFRGKGSRVHGANGLGGAEFSPPKSDPLSIRAVELILSRVMETPGEITLIAIGPLTNLALAVSVEPRLAESVREVIIMGGAATVPGNASPMAEANIYNDPEAAKIVFHAGWPLTMVGLDVTTKTTMTPHYLAKIKAAGTPITDFISAIIPFYLNYYRTQWNLDRINVHDPSAMAYAIDPSLFQTEKVYVDVEIGERRSSGQTMADLSDIWNEPANINLCLDVDSPRLLALYLERITSMSE